MRLCVFLLLLPFIYGCDFKISDYTDKGSINNLDDMVKKFVDECTKGAATLYGPSELNVQHDEQILQAVFKKVGKLNFTLHLKDSSWETLDLSALSTIKTNETIIIENNFNLKRVIIPSIFKCDGCRLKIRGNPQLREADIKNLQAVVARNNDPKMNKASPPPQPMEADIQKHGECGASNIMELKDLESCQYVYGDLIMEGAYFSGNLPTEYRLKEVDGCLIIDTTQISDAKFLFATKLNCYKPGKPKDDTLAYSYIGENAAMCGEHNSLIEDSLRTANPKTRISWQHNCEQDEQKLPDVKEEMDILKWDVKEEEESDEISFILLVIFSSLAFIVFVGPFILSKINTNYKRETEPYGPHGPISDADRRADKPFRGFIDYLQTPSDETYKASMKQAMKQE